MEELQPDTTNGIVPEEDQLGQERARERMGQVRVLIAQGRLEGAHALFSQLHPVDQGEVLMDLAREFQHALLVALPPAATAEILEHLDPEQAVEVSQGIPIPTLASILDETSLDVAVDILKLLSSERSQKTLDFMRSAQEVASLFQYPDDSAGGVMTLEYPVVRGGVTAGNALDVLRLLGPGAETVDSLIVLDDDGRLIGSLGVTRLALARPDVIVREIMDPDVISAPAEADQEEVARVMERYNLNHLPVLDENRRLVGVVLMEDVVDVMQEEATEDMYKMAGMGGERLFGPLHSSVSRRLPWLFLNLGTTILAALVISLFESTIAKFVSLAVFLPVVAGQGGIGGTQTLTLVVRGMALGEVSGPRGVRLLVREVSLGLVHGLFLGLGVGIVAYAWKGNFLLAVVLGVAMVGNMLVAGLAGAGIPLLLRRLRMDPAVASAVFITTMTDILGFLLFLGMAAALINHLA